MTKTRRVICALNIQEPGAYTETKFLKWLNGLDLKQHCTYWDQYKKTQPNWKEKPCPSDPKDVEGWMKHYSAKYTSPAQCTRRAKQLALAQKREDKTAQKAFSCRKKRCAAIREKLDTTFKLKQEPCRSLKQYRLSSKNYLKSPHMKCVRKVPAMPEIKRLVKQQEACEKQKCKKETAQSELEMKRMIDLAEQRS